MAVKAVQVTVPSDGTVVAVADSDGDTVYGDEVLIRNTGTVTVLLGGADGNCYMPLGSGTGGLGETYGSSVAPGDVVYCKVASNGTAGQVTAIKAK